MFPRLKWVVAADSDNALPGIPDHPETLVSPGMLVNPGIQIPVHMPMGIDTPIPTVIPSRVPLQNGAMPEGAGTERKVIRITKGLTD